MENNLNYFSSFESTFLSSLLSSEESSSAFTLLVCVCVACSLSCSRMRNLRVLQTLSRATSNGSVLAGLEGWREALQLGTHIDEI